MVVDGLEAISSERPAGAEELARVLGDAAGDGLAVIPVGGGRALGMGNPPARFDLALETSRLDRIVEFSPHDLTVTVEAGITLEALPATTWSASASRCPTASWPGPAAGWSKTCPVTT